jgi:predicted aspartyl protease
MVESRQQGTTIMSEVYCETVKTKTKLHRAIQNKMRGMLPSGVAILHDSEGSHTAVRTRSLLGHFNWGLFDHHP